jgi:hypothetical protein
VAHIETPSIVIDAEELQLLTIGEVEPFTPSEETKMEVTINKDETNESNKQHQTSEHFVWCSMSKL